MARIPYRIQLSEEELPRQWYNVRADMPEQPDPMLNPATMQAVTVDDLKPVFCEELCKQELDATTRYLDIPEEVLNFYRMYRPSPLIRAYRLEEELGTPAHIYYKFEGNNTSGSHKLNTAIAQAYYAKKQGLQGLTTETGAGQWGSALAMACAYYHLPLVVYMVKISFHQKPYRKSLIEHFGGKIIPSPSDATEVGRRMLAENPDSNGTLGTAISEAVEHAVKTPGYRYVLGSVLNQVLLHQSVIGLESRLAFEKIDAYPDVIIGCAGGGSNVGGLMYPFIGDKLTGKADPHLILVEPASCPSLTRGQYVYDFCDTGRITPLARMYTLGSSFRPSGIHAGGLRYHGMSPILSKLYHDGVINEARAVAQTKVFEAAELFSRIETILPAPESSHAIRVAIDEALRCKETGEKKNILFGLSGVGSFDMQAFTAYRTGQMTDYVPSDEELKRGLEQLPAVPENQP